MNKIQFEIDEDDSYIEKQS